jgi:hypothetical protein
VDAPPGGVDLLFAADAWHWIEPDRADKLATAALRPEGSVAIVSHQAQLLTGSVVAALDEAYDRWAPTIARAGVRAATRLHDRSVAAPASFTPCSTVTTG